MKDVSEKFKVGEKVRISGNQGFEIGATGIIDYSPKVPVIAEDLGDDYFRKVQTLKGEKLFVWVVFDKPQYGADGDGAYTEAEISIDFLEIIKG
jgi:hypothetical protein